MARAVHKAEPEDGVVFAEETVRQPAAQQRKKVHADDEGVEDILGFAGAVGRGHEQQKRTDQEWRKDVAHPVKAETFAAFSANNERDLPRHGSIAVVFIWLRHLYSDILIRRDPMLLLMRWQ